MNLRQAIQLTISKDYVSDWGIWEAIREILQNAFDSSNFEVKYTDNSIIITSFDGVIDKKHLILGNTTKREDSSKIGTYGEGFKLALLVLLRESKSVVIHNGRNTWTPCFDTHVELENECLNIIVEENVLPESQSEQVSFIIEGLTADEISLIKENSLYEKNITIQAENDGSYCWYSNGKPKLYVGGLFVCDLNKKYVMSYNFTPSILQLDRDRKSVCTFSLSYQATRLITLAGNYDLLAHLADKQAEDISDYYSFNESTYNYGYRSEESLVGSQDLKTIVSESFVKKHGANAYPINSQWDDKQKRIKTVKSIQAGLLPVVIKSGYYAMLSEALKTKELEDFKFNISEEIINFYENNKQHLRSKSKKELAKIVEMIKMIEGKELPEEMQNKVVVDTYGLDVAPEGYDEVPF